MVCLFSILRVPEGLKIVKILVGLVRTPGVGALLEWSNGYGYKAHTSKGWGIR